MAMERLVDIEVDSDFNIHTSYHNDFFLLRTKVLVNGENATITSVKEGSYEDPVMSFSHDGSTISTKLWLIANTISPILHKCGVYHVDTFYYGQSPLFHVVFSSESCLKKFLQEIGDVKCLMEVQLLSILSEYLTETESPQWLTTIVQPDLFLVSPSRHEAGETEVHLVTAENCSTFVAHWKNSKLFNFVSLHWEGTRLPRITTHPQQLKDAVPGEMLAFTIQASGAEPLNYQWEITETGDESGEWQSCDVERLPGAKSPRLIIPSVQKSNEGSYRCTVSNCAGRETSQCVTLTVANPPRITTHPQEVKDAVPGDQVEFTIQATGTQPLKYQWECKKENHVERIPGASSSTLTIPSVQKSNEGSYRCIVSNCAGNQTSKPAKLNTAEPPRITVQPQELKAECPSITAHPQELKNTAPGRPVSFTVKATGTEPLRYQWQWKPVVEGVSSGEWQNLSSGGSVQGADTATLTYSSIEACTEGLYRCVITNAVGGEISKCTDHIIGKITELHDCLSELSTVTQWYLLGIYLGLHPSTLDPINADYKTTKKCRTQMLIEWQRHVIPTWSAVVKALVGIGRERLASHLAAKYGVPLPNAVVVPLEELEYAETNHKMVAGPESAAIHYHRYEFQQLGGRLSDIEQLLKTKRDSQAPLNENVYNLMSELTKLGKEVQKIAQDVGNIESELQQRQHDSQLLREMQKDLAHSVEKCRLLQQMSNKNEEEITRLKKKLEKKKEQLLSVQQEAQDRKAELSKLQAELEEKNKEVKALQKEKKELARSYIDEKEEIKKLVQITLSDRDEMEQQLVTTKEELEHKSQQIAVCNSHISDLNKEVEALSSSLQEKEATVAQLESALHSYQKADGNLKLLSDILTLTTEIAELRLTLQEAEYQKQQSSLEKDVAVQEVEAKKKVKRQLHRHLDEPPKVTDHPKSRKDAVLYKPVTFNIKATGTEPLKYQWEHKTRDGNGEWQLCDLETFPGANSSTLTIPSMQKSNEGSYRCTVSNLAGSETSECATLTLAKPPRITTHPQEVKDAVPSKLVTFSIEATGTEPLSYQWQYEAGSEGWHLYDVERSPGANSSTLTIPRVKKSNEGSYYCIVSNCAGSETSKHATLSLAEPPRITTHPKDLANTVPGQQVLFTVQATGTKPLSYQWEYNPDIEGWSEEWQPCSGSNTDTLTIPSVQKSNEGSYRCVVSNCAGSRTSIAAELFDVAEPPRIISHPNDSTYTVPGQQVTFTVQATGTKPMGYQWQWNPGKEGVSDDWQPCSGADTATLTIQNVQNSSEGSYCCVISNCAGSQTSKPANLAAEPPRIITHPNDLMDAIPGNCVMFTIQATGTEPLNYNWQWNPAGEGASEKWQPCKGAEGSDTTTLTIPSVQKSNKGSYHCVIANCAGSQTSRPAKLEMHLLSELTWRRLTDMPGAMVYPQSVTVDTAVYIAVRTSGVILRYDPHTNEWTELPHYQYSRFTITELTHQLVMVGGYDPSTYKTSKTVQVYDPSQRSWKQPYPPMNTPRYYPAVSTYHQRLVVAGGHDDIGTDPASVEILDTSVRHCQWLSSTGLPVRCRRMSAAITHGTLYLLGGTLGKKVLSVSLSALTQTDKPPAQWRTLPDAPLEYSTAIAVHGSLSAVGGSHDRQRSSAIHVYDQEKNAWNKVGDLPTERQDCACCVLPSGEILVAGGRDRNGWTSRMDAAAVRLTVVL